MKKINSLSLIASSIFLVSTLSVNAQSWSLTGNAPTSTQFLGTTGAQDLRIRTGGSGTANQRMIITAGGNVGIGLVSTVSPLGRLDIKSRGASYLDGLNIVDNANVAKTSLVHTNGSFFLGIAIQPL